MKNFKTRTSIVMALGLIISSTLNMGTYSPKVIAQGITAVTQKQVIVVFKDTDSAKNKGLELKANGKLKQEFKNIKSLTANLSDSEILKLQKDPSVLSVEEDIKIKMISDYEDWGLTKIGAQKSWASGYTGSGVKVAVIDTGADLKHADLAIAGGFSAVAYTTSYQDDEGHGSHVAGIIAAQQNDIDGVGVAPGASVYAIKALDSTGSGYNSDIIEGIDWAIENNMDIVNMSLGSNTSSVALQNACDTAYKNGLLVVAAAGNDGAKRPSTKSTVDYPAKYESVIAVGATDSKNVRASFSSTGTEVEVAAPGVSIKSVGLNGGYAIMSGTSMASPCVAGDLALLKQANPDFTNVQLRALLNSNTTDLGTVGKDSLYGNGLIKAPVKAPVQ